MLELVALRHVFHALVVDVPVEGLHVNGDLKFFFREGGIFVV